MIFPVWYIPIAGSISEIQKKIKLLAVYLLFLLHNVRKCPKEAEGNVPLTLVLFLNLTWRNVTPPSGGLSKDNCSVLQDTLQYGSVHLKYVTATPPLAPSRILVNL